MLAILLFYSLTFVFSSVNVFAIEAKNSISLVINFHLILGLAWSDTTLLQEKPYSSPLELCFPLHSFHHNLSYFDSKATFWNYN